MRFHSMVWKEMFRRPGQSVTALLIVALGVSALVAVESVVASSEQKVALQMQQLGANILVLPEDVTLQDYHAADAHGRSLPEEYVSRITLAQKVGVEELAPKLSVPAELGETPIVVTGILPRTDFYKKIGMAKCRAADVGSGRQRGWRETRGMRRASVPDQHRGKSRP